MLQEFLTANRDKIILRTRGKVAGRLAPRATDAELERGIPLFLTQLTEMLAGDSASKAAEISESATKHGENLLEMGFTVSQVVHDYGGLCQSIAEIADEDGVAIGNNEFKTLNGCLDDAIAAAVSEFERRRERALSNEGAEHLGYLAHELRNVVNSAALAFEVLKTGAVGISGSTGGILGRSLSRMREIIDRSLAEVRLSAGIQQTARLSVADLIEEVGVVGEIEARMRDLQLSIGPVPAGLAVTGDRTSLVSALENLLQNALKFTRPGGHVSVETRATDDRVRIEIEDECGGLPTADAQDLFRAFGQFGTDRSGLGLGLAISRKGVESSGGSISVRDLPGKGCVFSVDLPRQA